jgi:hypothetical protein
MVLCRAQRATLNNQTTIGSKYSGRPALRADVFLTVVVSLIGAVVLLAVVNFFRRRSVRGTRGGHLAR